VAVLAVACAALPLTIAHAQLRIVAYNINASDTSLTAPRAGMDSVMSAIGASAKGGFSRPIDILLLGEASTVSTTGVQYANLLDSVFASTSYDRNSVNGGSTGGGRSVVVYNTASVTLVGEKPLGSIATQPRQTMRYQFRPVGYDAAADFYIYASHLKASTGSANVAERNLEVTVNRADADALGQGANILYAGDFNFYTSSESGFQTLTGTGNGQAFDPINRIGSWHGSSSFMDVHTQSPATVSAFGGQVTGGMDDRFDFQMTSGEVLDGRGFDYVGGSYWAFGNTGTHTMKGAIDSGSAEALAALIPGYTTAQAQTVLTNLTKVTDHLAVVADYQLPAKMAASLASLPAQAIRGASLTATLAVSNAAPVTAAKGADRLDYTFSSTGALAGSGSGSALALGSPNSHAVSVDTSVAGLRSGSATVTTSSPQAISSTFTQGLSLSVLDHAIGSFDAATTTTTYDIDFGTLTQGGTAASRSFGIYGREGSLGSAWTAKLDLDSIVTSGSAGIFSTTLAPFTNLASGSSRTYSLSMSTLATGSFVATYLLNTSDEDLAGATSHTLTLNVRGTVVPSGPVDTVRTVAAGQRVVDSAVLTGAGRLVKQGAGELVRGGTSSFTGGTVVEAGTLTVASPLALGTGPLTVAAGAGVSLGSTSLSVTVLDLATAGVIDVGTGRITVAAGGITSAAIEAKLAAGLGDGSWNGTSGIRSSSAGAERTVGWIVDDGGAATIAFAAPGDTNLDGIVDILDALNIMASDKFGRETPSVWSEGNFNYDGIVDILDVVLFLSAGLYDESPYLPAAGSLPMLSEAGSAVVAVPEPSALGMLAVAAVVATAGRIRWRARRCWRRAVSGRRAPSTRAGRPGARRAGP